MAELTYRLFMVATVGMLAGTVFLLASSREVDPKHRRGVYISALVTGIAWYHYNKTTAPAMIKFLFNCFLSRNIIIQQ